MLKKLSQFFNSLFSSSDSEVYRTKEARKELIEPHRESILESAEKQADKLIAEKIATQEKQTVTMHLDTGKIIFPENMSPEDKAEVEAALAELNTALQGLAPEDMYKSLEEFISKAGGGVDERGEMFEGLIKVNLDEDALAKVKEEMEFCDEQTEHWNDGEFAQALYEFESQGYEFDGIDPIYIKINEKLELSQSESAQLRSWYKLATQESVYAV